MSHATASVADSAPHPFEIGRTHSKGEGFTLLELLIAMLIAVIMVGVVFYLFSSVQAGTRTSMLRAQLALNALTLEARLRSDAKYMLGPSRDGTVAGGAIIIIPAIRQGYIPLPNGTMSRNKVRLRSDQLVFFSKRDPTHPHPWISLIPQEQNTPPGSASTSYEGRVWYGALRDGNLTPGSTESLQAHHWLVGRDLKLIQKTTAGAIDLTLSPLTDLTPGGVSAGPATPGGVINVQAAASSWNGSAYAATGWDDLAYVKNLIGENPTGTAIPDSNTDYGNQPTSTPLVDLKQLQGQGSAAANANGIQLSDLAQAHMRLLDNCSEIVVQWAGDLDKDGAIDTYPVGHPLAGSIIWYPEEFHPNPAKDITTRPRLTAALQTAYDNEKGNYWWWKTFPAGFAPALGAWPNGRFGALGTLTTPVVAPTPAWAGRFQLEYNESDGTGSPRGQTTAAPNVPAPYVFRFEDDQYRLVRYGFRQDGSVYANKFDAKAKTAPAGGGIAHFPAYTDTDPVTHAATQVAALDRHWTPYPPTPAAATTNPTPTQLYVGVNSTTAPSGPYPRTATTANAAGLNFGDGLGDLALPGSYRDSSSAVAPFGNVLNITQAGAVTTSGTAAAGTETYYNAPTDTPYSTVPGDFGPTNNHTAVYGDLYSEYFKSVSDPRPATHGGAAGGITDWRNPQSDWPKLIRMRLRLHDAQGLIASYSDEALMNGRDNDGDGVVNNPEEGRISGVWYEYIFAVPYPMDPTPRSH